MWRIDDSLKVRRYRFAGVKQPAEAGCESLVNLNKGVKLPNFRWRVLGDTSGNTLREDALCFLGQRLCFCITLPMRSPLSGCCFSLFSGVDNSMAQKYWIRGRLNLVGTPTNQPPFERRLTMRRGRVIP